MKKILFVVALLSVVVTATTYAQWTEKKVYSPFKEVLKPDNLWGLHGLAVDPEGKIWVAPYNGTDTITIGSGANDKRREIFVFHPDGTPASFSPIKVIEVDGVKDSLNHNNTTRGLTADHQGNMLYSSWDRIFRINYKTGVGMNKVAVWDDLAGNNGVSVDGEGNIFVGQVVGTGSAYKIYANDFSFLGNALDAKPAIICRTSLVSADGKLLYLPNIYGAKYIGVFENQFGPGFGTYDIVDSVLLGMQSESMAWQNRTDKSPLLWASAGSRENAPDAPYTIRTWYGYDTELKQVVDSISWGVTFAGNPTYDDTVANAQAARPRGIAFTASGDTAYVGMFLADSNSVKMFVRNAVGVSRNPDAIAREFELSQNYPNPFNPTTQITFSLKNSSSITLKVYDVLGKEIATLADGVHSAGVYTARFDALHLSGGVYFYTLKTSEGFVETKKMLLIK
jgi:hypothetical protein